MTGHESQAMSDAHRECWDSLPWLANERLSPREAARIGKHLRQCGECQQELATQQQLREVIRGGDDPLVLAPQAGLQRLMSRIDAEERGTTTDAATTNDEPRASRSLAWRRRPWLAIAAAVQTITIGALLAGLMWQTYEMRNAPSFKTLSLPTPAVAEGPVLRVVFADSVVLREVNELLRELDAQIVSGPSPDAGVYTLVLHQEGGQQSDPRTVLARLKADSRVSFAEPAQVEGR